MQTALNRGHTVNLNALNFTLPLSNIYEGVFPSAPNPS